MSAMRAHARKRAALPLAVLFAMSGCMFMVEPPFESRTECDVGYSETICDCTYEFDDANDERCDVESVGNGVCCADNGWPARDLECSCNGVVCRQTSTGCSCTLNGEGSRDECTGSFCCKDTLGCDCGTEPCSDSQTQVPKCDASVFDCSADELRVEQCSIFLPQSD